MRKFIIDIAYDLNCTDCELRIRNRNEVVLEATIPAECTAEFAKDYAEDIKMVDRRIRERFVAAPEIETEKKMRTLTTRWTILGPVAEPIEV